MSDPAVLPDDLTAEEARLALRLVAEAHGEAERDAAKAIGVRRSVLRYAAEGHGIGAALALVADDGAWGVSEGTARDIWYRRGRWAVG